MKSVKIYSKSFCPFCHQAVDLLEKKKVPMEIIDITEDEEALTQLSTETDCSTVPQIFIDGKFIGGCDDLMDLERKGELNALLGI